MTIRYISSGLTVVSLILMTSLIANGQKDSLRQEVEVIKSYAPVTIDAEKINEMPVIKDVEHKKPNFSYSIESKPIYSTLSVNNLQAAVIVGKPKEEPGYGLVRAGVGNYNKPYGELYFNNKNNKNSIFGLHAKHLSSFSKLNLEGGDRVKAPFSESEAEMFLKYMWNKSTLSLNFDIDHNAFRYYGYPGADTIPSFLKASPNNYTWQGEKQTFTNGGIHVNLENIHTSKSDPATGFEFQYYRFGSLTGQKEHFAKLNLDFYRPQDAFTFIINGGFEYSNTDNVYYLDQILYDVLPIPANRKQTWFYFKPAIFIGNNTINLKAGFKTWLTFGNYDGTNFKMTPDVRFNFVPVKEIINLFAGIDGNYYHNHYSTIAYENPFLNPELCVKNHLEKYRFYGGFDGKLSAKTNFKIQVDHSVFEGHPFYYLQGFRLPTMGPAPGTPYIDNTFRVLYDDLKTTKFNGEITHSAGDKINLLLSANIYKYNTREQDKPWNMPAFDATLALSYKVDERLSLTVDLYAIGRREGLVVQTNSTQSSVLNWMGILKETTATHTAFVMPAVVDMNVRGSYDITRKFALFAQLNNLGFQKYQRWLGYPVQSFNFLAGFSFSF